MGVVTWLSVLRVTVQCCSINVGSSTLSMSVGRRGSTASILRQSVVVPRTAESVSSGVCRSAVGAVCRSDQRLAGRRLLQLHVDPSCRFFPTSATISAASRSRQPQVSRSLALSFCSWGAGTGNPILLVPMRPPPQHFLPFLPSFPFPAWERAHPPTVRLCRRRRTCRSCQPHSSVSISSRQIRCREASIDERRLLVGPSSLVFRQKLEPTPSFTRLDCPLEGQTHGRRRHFSTNYCYTSCPQAQVITLPPSK